MSGSQPSEYSAPKVSWCHRLHVRPLQWNAWREDPDISVPVLPTAQATAHWWLVMARTRSLCRRPCDLSYCSCEAIHRRFHGGLGCASGRAHLQRHVVSKLQTPNQTTHQGFRDAGCQSGSSSLQSTFSLSSASVDRQHGRRVIHQQGGRHTVGLSEGKDTGFVLGGHVSPMDPPGGTHSGTSQCDSRSPVQGPSCSSNRVVTASRSGKSSLRHVRTSSYGSVCHSPKLQAGYICVTHARSPGMGGGRSVPSVDGLVGLHVPPSSNHGEGASSSARVSVRAHPNSPSLATSTMVCRSPGAVSGSTAQATTVGQTPNTANRDKIPPGSLDAPPARL